MPDGLSHQEAWAIVRQSRQPRRTLPLRDVDGLPFSYWVPEHFLRTLSSVDRNMGGSLMSDKETDRDLEPIRKQMVRDSLMDEAIATSQIEGAVTTRKLAREMLAMNRKPRDKSEQMIVNGFRTMEMIRRRLDEPLSTDLIHDIQRQITDRTMKNASASGRFRETDDVEVVSVRDEEVIYRPPPAADLSRRIALLLDFANAPVDTGPFIHPLIRASILHFWLAYEHPYEDGNGRTARAISYWYMLKQGYWLFEMLTISRVIHQSQKQYYYAFVHSERDENDLTYFLHFILHATSRSMEALHEKIQTLKADEAQARATMLAVEMNARQRAFVSHLSKTPGLICTVESYRAIYAISNEQARKDLNDLLAKKLLVETGRLRPREFLAAPDLRRRISAGTIASTSA